MKNSGWMRFFFLLVFIQAANIGRALIWPEVMAANLPWPASPLNARFIAALYWMGAISALLCMIAQHYTDVRISLIEVGFVTGVLLLLTLPHLGEFTPTTFPYIWIILYTIDPLLVILILWRMRGRDRVPAVRNRFAPCFTAYASVLGVAGVVLLVAPTFAAQLWPWTLPPILGQVYSIFFLTFALGGLLAAHEPHWEGVWIYVVANLGMMMLIVAVSLYHADRFKTGPATWAWYSFMFVGILAFVSVLARRSRPLSTRGAMP